RHYADRKRCPTRAVSCHLPMMDHRRTSRGNGFLSPSLSCSPSIELLPSAGDPTTGESQIEGDKVEEVEALRDGHAGVHGRHCAPPILSGQGNVTFGESSTDSRVRAPARA